MTRRQRARLYYVPEAALTLGITVRRLRYWLYHPLYRPQFTHLTRRGGAHPRRLRVLTDRDLDQLCALAIIRGLSPLLTTPGNAARRAKTLMTRILSTKK